MDKETVQRLSIKLFQVTGKNEIWHKDALRNGEVKLIRSPSKIDIKTISGGGGLLFSLPMFACKEENVKFLHFEFMI